MKERRTSTERRVARDDSRNVRRRLRDRRGINAARDDRPWVFGPMTLLAVECPECEGGVILRITGESSFMGGIEPMTLRPEECEECENGLLPCVECGETPAYLTDTERLCVEHMREAAEEAAEEARL